MQTLPLPVGSLSQPLTAGWVSCLQLTTGEKMVGLSLSPEIAARVLGDVEAEFGK